MYADTILNGGTVLTVDDQFSVHEAIAVRDGRIIAVGTSQDIDKHAGPDTAIRDLDGATLMPGFVEAHGHPTAEMELLRPGVVDVRASACGTAEEVIRRLKEAVTDAEAGGSDWVMAFGWDPLLLPDLPRMSGEFLTALSPRVPLSVMHYSVHSSWANKAALNRLGMNADTPNPGGSEFLRDVDGQLTGEALEVPATMILMGPNFDVGDEQFADTFSHELERMARVGVTTTGDLAFHPDKYAAVKEYYDQRTSAVRVRAYEMSGARDGVPVPADTRSTDPSLFRTVGVKVWTDGSPWVGNIATSFGYEESRATETIGVSGGHKGCSNYTRDQLLDICRTNFREGWQMACHVHGDLAVDMVLDVFDEIQNEFPGQDGRLRMEHCGTITPEQVRRAHEMNASISFFVAHIHYYGDILSELFGRRADAWTPAGAAEECGMRFSLHNDPPVTPESPLLNMQAAVTRVAPSGRVMGPEFRISVESAIRAQTIDAAWQLHSDEEIGSLEIGKFADLVILDKNPLDVDENSLSGIQVLETWVAGDLIYQSKPSYIAG